MTPVQIDALVTLRTAMPEDAVFLHELHAASVRALCSTHYSTEIIEGCLLNRTPSRYLPPINRGAIFVAEVNRTIVGFGEAAPGVLVAVYVDPVVAGRGIGQRILQHALALACRDKRDSVMVESTLNAAAFYERHGFREVSRGIVGRNHVQVPVVVLEYTAA
jgi:GNAT superfamily N-acetyltransferase